MLKVGVLLCLVGLVVAAPRPSNSSSEEKVQSFRTFLENFKHGDDYHLSERRVVNPNGSAWESSGKFEGDIVLDQWQINVITNDSANARNAYVPRETKWPKNTIVYHFSSGQFTAEQKESILAAIKEIEKNTCLRFRVRTQKDNDYVNLTNKPDGCYATIGYWRGRGIHTMNLANGCFSGTTIIHEWLHIIGFFHMQSTYNRDDYVRILWDNISPGAEHNFNSYNTKTVSNLGLPYEYISTMHYGTHFFSKNGRPTIEATRDFEGEMGQSRYVTFYDWLRVNRHYNCPSAWDDNIENIEQLRVLVHQ